MINIKNGAKLSALTLALMTSFNSSADIQHLDDVIITFSACIGNDCVNGESFGFDTMRIKENNLRIHAQDTSTSASFPSNDWRLVFNDSSNGGANYFAVEDSNSARQVFRVDAGAPASALYVDAQGDIGVGTSTPVVDIHVKSGNTPTLRLEQDGSSGFGAQIWDVAGNEANFFIRDASNGSKLSFRIEPSAPQDSIYIEDTGDIGIGTSSPSTPMHVVRNGSNAQLLMERVGAGIATITGANSAVNIGAQSDHNLKLVAGNGAGSGGDVKVTLETDGDMIMGYGATGAGTGGQYTASTGTWDVGSSRSLKEKIFDLSTEDALKAINQLNPVTFHYKNNSEQQVGFIAEDVPDLVSTKSRKTIRPIDIVSVLTKVVQEQQKMISELEEKVNSIEK